MNRNASKTCRYTYSSIFATQIIAAANFAEYWGLAQVYQTVAFYALSPVVILFINFAGVSVMTQDFGILSNQWLTLCSILVGSRLLVGY
jgi:hypothetical protein